MTDSDLMAMAGAPGAWALFFALLVGHALADFPLQGEFLACYKRRCAVVDGGMALGGRRGDVGAVVWPYCLTAHALIHGGFVWIITGFVWLGVAELVLHWAIDFFKGEEKISFHTDQALHVACKAGYVAVIAAGWLSFAGGDPLTGVPEGGPTTGPPPPGAFSQP